MKYRNLLFAIVLWGCNQQPGHMPAAEDTVAVPPAQPAYSLPVVFPGWKMGAPENTRLVIDMYKAWNERNPSAAAGYFADSVVLDLPAGRRLTVSNQDIYRIFSDFRQAFDSLSNRILVAYALHNEDNGDEWVVVMTYNTWHYRDGRKDSTVFLDNWRLTGNKITYLNSFEQDPSRALLKKLDRAK